MCTLYNIIIVALINAALVTRYRQMVGAGAGAGAAMLREDIHPLLVLVHNVTTPGSVLTLHVTCYMLHVTCYRIF